MGERDVETGRQSNDGQTDRHIEDTELVNRYVSPADCFLLPNKEQTMRNWRGRNQ